LKAVTDINTQNQLYEDIQDIWRTLPLEYITGLYKIIDPSSVTVGLIFVVPLWMAI